LIANKFQVPGQCFVTYYMIYDVPLTV